MIIIITSSKIELIAKNKIMKVINKKLGFNILSERYKIDNLKIIDDEYSFMYDFTFNKKRYQVEYLKYLKEVDFAIVK